jgi:hypothetical protein
MSDHAYTYQQKRSLRYALWIRQRLHYIGIHPPPTKETLTVSKGFVYCSQLEHSLNRKFYFTIGQIAAIWKICAFFPILDS